MDDYYYRLLDDKDVDCVFQPEIFVIAPVLKVRFLGKSTPMTLTHGRIYDVLDIERGWYRIIDETDEDYLYGKDCFEIIERLG
ncbi:hypothetical protein [Treponema primitia]|uniref:hypothetical protein n=1 Tax=Treponema primitia TaxID=88058 RepID=UPI0002EBEC08|nr:hypothetical protein [Treponema primitia]